MIDFNTKTGTVMSFDTETPGLYPYLGHRMFAYSICTEDGATEVYRLDGKRGDPHIAERRLREFWCNTTIAKVGHNIKFDLAMVLMEGIKVPEETTLHDTRIMSCMLRNDLTSHSLDYLAKYYGRYVFNGDDDVAKIGKKLNGYQNIDPDLMYAYQVADAERTMLLFRLFWPEIQADPGMLNDYLHTEIPLVWVTQRMEQTGLHYDKTKARQLAAWLSKESAAAIELIKERTGIAINVNSRAQIENLLYKTLGLPVPHLTDKGEPSADKDSLIKLTTSKHADIVSAIIKARSYLKGISTIQNYEKHVDSSGRIHPNINTNGAETGRESCDNPNLQNMAKAQGLKNFYPVPLRRAIRCYPDCILLFVDYKGIEMRLIAGIAGEIILIDMLKRDNNADLHYPTMECFLSPAVVRALKKYEPDTFHVLRSALKNVGFCVGYGGGCEKVSMTLGVTPLDNVLKLAPPTRMEVISAADDCSESLRVIDGDTRYRNKFKSVASFSSVLAGQVADRGYITTAFGRRLYIPQSKAYIAANYMIQGTAAHIIKRAQVRVDNLLRKEYNNYAHLLLPVHDELVLSMSRELLPKLQEFKAAIRELMITIPEVNVPLEVEWKMSTTTWESAK